MTSASPTSVTVLGLGAMGRALARTLLTAGHPTTVWNRTPGRATDLIAAGAIERDDPAKAIEASDLAVVCVLDHVAVREVLDAAAESLHGATIVDLTSATPEQSRELAALATDRGARYLSGAIMATTPMVGDADALFLYSGDTTVFAEHAGTLRVLGGAAELLGDDPGVAATFDLAMLDVFFNGMAAFLHAASLLRADGVPATDFVPYADRVLKLLEVVNVELATNVDRGEHPGTEDNLDMELAALNHIVATSDARGIDSSVARIPRDLARAAVDLGHGRDNFSRVVDVLRAFEAARPPRMDVTG
jgi:3-hydroxyisobutyrate dehydrogenase-like beta-hydroxyacid dehydrogenase